MSPTSTTAERTASNAGPAKCPTRISGGSSGGSRTERGLAQLSPPGPLLKFDVTCNDIVPLLQSEGAEVTFVPFDGGHDAPTWVKDAFLDAVFGRVAGSQARSAAEDAAATCRLG